MSDDFPQCGPFKPDPHTGKSSVYILSLIHICPDMQHHGLAAKLLGEAIRYAESHRLMISLETHNPGNVPLYEHFGFKVFGIVEKHFNLKQYCLVREVQ